MHSCIPCHRGDLPTLLRQQEVDLIMQSQSPCFMVGKCTCMQLKQPKRAPPVAMGVPYEGLLQHWGAR